MSLKKDYRGAIQNCNKAIDIVEQIIIDYPYPNITDYYNLFLMLAYQIRAISKSGLGDDLGVIQDCKKAIELNPNFDALAANDYSRMCVLK